MKDGGSVWDQLGLDATDDTRAIRRAYSRRLKAIDVDADPGAFITLRHALDTALALAASMAPALEPIVSGGHDDGLSLTPPELKPQRDRAFEPEQPAPERARPEVQFTDGDIDPAIPARLNALLFDESALGASPDQIRSLTKTLLAQAANARIDKVANIEAWLAVTIANAIPRSDVMIDLAVKHFRWAEEKEGQRKSPALEAILNQQADLHFLEEIAEPDHRLHAAYQALKAPPSIWTGLVVGRKLRDQVEALLGLTRRNHPKTLAKFDAKTVKWWSPQAALRRRRVVSVIVVVGLLGLAWLGTAVPTLLGQMAPNRFQIADPDRLQIGDDVCPWRSDANGLQVLFCRDAKGQLISAAPAKVRSDISDRAKAGDTDAMVAMGRFYAASPSIASNGRTAETWFRKAADRGDPDGMLALGLLNGTGTGVEGDGVNLVEAARWYQAAADHELPQAKFMLGSLYVRGQVVPKDDARAAALFKAAADDGWVPAKSALGLMYEKGLGAPASRDDAVRLYTEASADGDPVGDYLLAQTYLSGKRSPQLDVEAARLLHGAMDNGMVEAMVPLAILYHKGEGVDANDGYAFLLLQAAAGQGKVAAIYDLGVAYRIGMGVKKNDAEAARWFRAAGYAGDKAGFKQLQQMHVPRQGPTAQP